MTLTQMVYIIEIDRCGSMNKAARNLFISQTGISSAVNEVESELGITIFTRTNRGIILTDDGRELVNQIGPIVERCRAIERFYAERDSSKRVQLSIASQRYPFCAKAFVDFIQELEEPLLQLSFKEMEMAAVIDDVSTRQSELGILFVSEMTEHFIDRILASKNLEFKGLAEIQPHVFLRKNHPLANRKILTAEELQDYPYVAFFQTDNNLNFAEEAVPASAFSCDKTIWVTDRATFYNITAHTDAFSIGSGVLPEGYSDERLLAIPLESQYAMRLGYIKIKDAKLSQAAASFIDTLTNVMNELRL
ncbi:MAG: LysR family transcriptional regulator [Clostridia bacterium]|nr:LysR family transcriptional regulator [Clostridia bacterium]